MTKTTIRKIRPFADEAKAPAEPVSVISLSQPVSLADKKYELTRLKEQVEMDLAQIDAELKAQMKEGEVVSTHHGIGYRLSVATQDIYDQRAVRELSRMRLLPRFVRVSTTRLKELVSEGKLSQKKFNDLRTLATAREIATLREVSLETILANAHAS